MKRHLLSLLLLSPILIFAQQQRAYFQQEVNYKIDVALNDRKHMLSANIEMEYINRSPDTLTEIWMHLWPNGYKGRNTALCNQKLADGDASLYFADEEKRGYIDSLEFTTDNESVKWDYHRNNTDICVLHLNKPLLPGNRVLIRTPFIVKIPDATFSRMGHSGQAYAISQWYPKPAVYDRNGWHPIPYLDQGEFYSEYGSFNVSITLPANYVVAATGDLQTESELQWLNQKAAEPKNISKEDPFPPSDTKTKTIRYTQKNVHDFAWFADKRYYVSKGEVTLPQSGNKVTTWTLYRNREGEYWKNAINYLNQAVLFYSEKVGEYPYNNCTALFGPLSAGGGMEYPNVTIIGETGSGFLLDAVIAHEVGHNWFYGILGSNERDHPWMDEGMNSSVESRYVLHHYPTDKFGKKNELSDAVNGGKLIGIDKFDYHESSLFEYQLPASIHIDQPIEMRSSEYLPLNYGAVVYKKTALAFDYLRAYLGESLYDQCMHAYFEEWKFKHPQPQDVKAVFEKVSGKNLSWFFDDLFNTTNQQDFALRKPHLDGTKANFTVQQRSGIAAPFVVSGLKNGTTITEQWFEADQTGRTLEIPCQGCDKLVIDPNKVMIETNYRNNGGISRLPKLRLFPTVNTQDRNYVYITPVAAWNDYNKTMAGVAIYNKFLPFRKLEYAIVPLYAFGNKELAGTANISYSFYPASDFIQEISWSNQFRMFTYGRDTYRTSEMNLTDADMHYKRFSPTITVHFKLKDPRARERKTLEFQSVHLWEDQLQYQMSPGLNFAHVVSKYKDFYRLRYTHQNYRRIDPYMESIGLEANQFVFKGDLEGQYAISYRKLSKKATFRVYLGYTFSDNSGGLYGFFLSDRNAARGTTDYAYDDLYFGRTATEGFWYQQMYLRQGGFKSYSPLGSYRSYIAALNINIDLPIPLPIRIYGDIGTAEDFKKDVKAVYDVDQLFSYNAGLCLSLARDVVEVYLPLVKSQEIVKYNETNDISLLEEIRFVFNISRLSPANLRNQLRR
ncbi:MAG: M1 family metallopeptidase [Bacteroidia bacterium]